MPTLVQEDFGCIKHRRLEHLLSRLLICKAEIQSVIGCSPIISKFQVGL
ncbi:unnamed protein product [Blumeria hordei]|uniref:Uncharacterized protein n=1 Tax=Blumeria hordei TaxID=2867405 RepID=A0A383UVX4_BLUHO|nr:unnamed protein product [Blumeria hordei]